MSVLQWEESREVRMGEGISRTSADKTQLFELKVWMPGQGAMRDLVKAESLKQAIFFAENRYPNCRIEVPAKTAKPKLVRSHTGPRVAARAHKKLAEGK